MKKTIMLLLLLMPLICLSQFYIGSSEEQILDAIQKDASKIQKEYFPNNTVVLRWIEYQGSTGYVVVIKDNISYKTFIRPLTKVAFQQWLTAINRDFTKGEKANTWVSYTSTGTFLISLTSVGGEPDFLVQKTTDY